MNVGKFNRKLKLLELKMKLSYLFSESELLEEYARQREQFLQENVPFYKSEGVISMNVEVQLSLKNNVYSVKVYEGSYLVQIGIRKTQKEAFKLFKSVIRDFKKESI